MTPEELKADREYYEELRKWEEEERKRMSCGKCEACKKEGEKLHAWEIWDICGKCYDKFRKAKAKKN
jgi:hypothetical protein